MSTTKPSTNKPSTDLSVREVLRNRNVGLLFGAKFASTTAAMVLFSAMSVHVFDITSRKRDLGFLGLVEFIPALVLVFAAGTVVDRFDRRRVAAIGLGLEVLVVVILLAIDFTNVRTAAPFLLLTFLLGCSRAFVGPSLQSVVPAAAPDGQLARVVALGSATWQFAIILGPLIGTFAYKAAPKLAYAIAGFLIAVAIIMILALPERIGQAHLSTLDQTADEAEKSTFKDAFKGLAVVRRQPILLGAITLDLFAVLFGGAIALLPAVAKEVLGGGASDVGVLRAAGGIGATAVTLMLAVRPLTKRVGHWLLVAVFVFGAATIVFGLSKSLWISVVAMFVLHGADSVSVFVRSTLVPLVTPAAERGRVLAVESVFIGASNELGAFESGEVAHHFGTVPSIVSGGIITMVVVVAACFLFPALRKVDRFEDLSEA